MGKLRHWGQYVLYTLIWKHTTVYYTNSTKFTLQRKSASPTHAYRPLQVLRNITLKCELIANYNQDLRSDWHKGQRSREVRKKNFKNEENLKKNTSSEKLDISLLNKKWRLQKREHLEKNKELLKNSKLNIQ